MKYEYNKDFKITYTELDSNAKLSLASTISLVQDMVTEYFESFKSDNLTIKTNNNAVWVLTKTKIKFNNFPSWREKISAKVYTVKNSKIRSEAEIVFKDENNNIPFIAKQEYCVLDLDSRKIRKIDSIDYPADMDFAESKYTEEYSKLNDTFDKENFGYSQIIYSQDIDFSKHTNNVVYVRYILNTLKTEFFDTHKILGFEIHYISESREGEELKIYKKEKENMIEFLIKENEKDVVRANLIFEKTN